MMTTDIVKKDILLAEDDIDDVLVFEMALKELGIPVDLKHVDDGEKLFKALKQYIPDILFLDIHLPCKDGVACIIEIRKNHEYDNMPVIMYTSHRSDNYIEQCFRNGANMYLVKRDTLMELAAKLKTILSVDWKKNMYYPPKQEFVLS